MWSFNISKDEEMEHKFKKHIFKTYFQPKLKLKWENKIDLIFLNIYKPPEIQANPISEVCWFFKIKDQEA